MADDTNNTSPTTPAIQARKSTWPWRLFLLLAVLMGGIILAGEIRTQPKYLDLVNWRSSYDTAAREAASDDKPMLVVFGADWCQPCQMMKAWVYSSQDVADTIESGFVPFYADMTEGVGPNAELAQRYGLTGVPSLLVLDAEGNPITGFSGYMNKADMLLWLHSAQQRYHAPAQSTAS